MQFSNTYMKNLKHAISVQESALRRKANFKTIRRINGKRDELCNADDNGKVFRVEQQDNRVLQPSCTLYVGYENSNG